MASSILISGISKATFGMPDSHIGKVVWNDGKQAGRKGKNHAWKEC